MAVFCTWYTCKCPCPTAVENISENFKGALECRSGNQNLRSCDTEDEARNTVFNHLTASPFHNFDNEMALEFMSEVDVTEQTMTEPQYDAWCAKHAKRSKAKASGENLAYDSLVENISKRLNSMEKERPIGARRTDDDHDRRKQDSSDEDDRGKNDGDKRRRRKNADGDDGRTPAPKHRRAIGNESSGSTGGDDRRSPAPKRRRAIEDESSGNTGSKIVRVTGGTITIRRSELVCSLDYITRAARAARGAERLCKTACGGFKAEAEALEQALEHLDGVVRDHDDL
jgi:hypothetical protein